MDWYDKARAEIRETYGADAPLFARLLAATSPQVDVKRNVTLARAALVRHKRGLAQRPWIPAHAANIERALQGEPLKGPKVRAFARALEGDDQAVVVDTWMLRAAGLRERNGDKRVVALAILKVSALTGAAPVRVQARIWLEHRQGNWTARKGKGDGYIPVAS